MSAIPAGQPNFIAHRGMHPDRKIGIAMGILLVGVVGALFFRNEPLVVDESLTARREKELNQQLRDRDVSLYSNDQDPGKAPETEDAHRRLEEILRRRESASRALPVPVKRLDKGDVTSPAERLNATDTPKFESPVKSNDAVANRTPDDDASPATGATEMANVFDQSGTAEHNAADFEEYKVQFGDTLSGIAAKHLGSSTRYKEIYEANRDRMSSPDQLKVGKAIRIPRQRL